MIRSASEVPVRAIIISECPAHCDFCHFEGGPRDGRSLSLAEVSVMAEVAASLSVKQIQLTGGEPLLRNDIPHIVYRILDRHPSAKIALTTSGLLLTEGLARTLYSCGVNKLNVSLAPWLFEACRIQKPSEVEDGIERLMPLVMVFAENAALKFNFTVKRDWLVHLPNVIGTCSRLSVPLDCMTVGWHPGLTEDWYRSAYVEPSTVIKILFPFVQDIALRFEATPYLELLAEGKTVGRLKDPGISRAFRLRECVDCPFSGVCPETSCAVRVYPGWHVGACLLDLKRGEAVETATETGFRESMVTTYGAIAKAIDKLTFLQFGKSKQVQ